MIDGLSKENRMIFELLKSGTIRAIAAFLLLSVAFLVLFPQEDYVLASQYLFNWSLMIGFIPVGIAGLISFLKNEKKKGECLNFEKEKS